MPAIQAQKVVLPGREVAFPLLAPTFGRLGGLPKKTLNHDLSWHETAASH